MNQCMNLPVAGDVVGILPGVSNLASTNNHRFPAFTSNRSGTSSQRIVYVTKYAAVALPNVATNANRTELRHDGTAPRANGDNEIGTGCPIYGSYFVDYITFDGFFVDMARAYPKTDSGVIRVESARGVHFRNFEIKGTTTNMQSNPIIYRPQNARDTVLSNFRAYDFINDPTNSTVPQQALFSDQYGDQNFLIEHFEIRNTQRGIFLKGTVPGPIFNYGRIRFGAVSHVSSCLQFNDLDPVNLTIAEYNLCYDILEGAGIRISSETSPGRNILIHHNTVAKVRTVSPNTMGCMNSRASGLSSNVIIRDNICDLDLGRFGHQIDFSEISTLPATLDFNLYYKNGENMSWAYNGQQLNSFTDWRNATGRDSNSQVLANSPFVDRTNDDFRIPTGHVAKTSSSSGAEVGAYAGPETPGVIVPTASYP